MALHLEMVQRPPWQRPERWALTHHAVGDAHPIAGLRVLDAWLGHLCHSTAQMAYFPGSPFSSTVRGSPHGMSEPSTSAFRTLDVRISPPRACEATRAAMMTLRPKKSSPS